MAIKAWGKVQRTVQVALSGTLQLLDAMAAGP